MRGVHLFLFLVTLPFIAALGHDIYLFYINEGIENAPEVLQTGNEDKGGFLSLFATLGYIWTTYHPESYKTVVQSVDKETWAKINFLLGQKAVFLGLIFAGFFYILTFVLGMLKKDESMKRWKEVGKAGGQREDLRFLKRSQKNKFKYKRK